VANVLTLAYPWTKALHVIAMIAWMAGLFYLPRLYVYHAERANRPGELSETFKVMEDKLLRLIMTPSMIATWAFGLLLLATPGLIAWTSDGWIWVKLAALGAMTWFHVWLARRRREFAADGNTRSGRQYRMMNEVPTILLVIIVVMVIVKPF
jgi:protoporphyrinogen IX oxidase